MARARAVRMATGTVTTAVGMGVGVVYMAGSVPFPVAPMRADVVPGAWVAYAAGRGSVARVGPSSHPILRSGAARPGQRCDGARHRGARQRMGAAVSWQENSGISTAIAGR